MTFREHRNHAEAVYLLQAIEEARGNLRQAARASGLSRGQFHRLVLKHWLQDRVALARLRAKAVAP